MLQFSGKESRIKHKALLVGPTPPTDTMLKPDPSVEPQMLPGHAFERMCMDPELILARKRFFIGVGVVAALVVLAAILQISGVWNDAPAAADEAQPTRVATEKVKTSAPVVPPAVAKPLFAEETIKKLSFRGATPKPQVAVNLEPKLVLEKFLAATSVEEKLALVVNAEKVADQLRDFYSRHPTGAVAYEKIEQEMKSSESFVEFRVVMKDGTRKFAAVVPTPVGPRVDWASFVALGDLEWEQMRESRPQKPVLMRVLAAPAANFSGHFSDADSLRCVRLVPASNPSAKPVYGYVPRASELDRELDYLLRSAGGELAPLTVKLCYSPESEVNDQTWITKLVVSGWVTAASPLHGEGE